LSWVTLDLVPRSLRLAFLNAAVTPLVDRLRSHQISPWYDQEQIDWGGDIPQEINAGLVSSRFMIVVLSRPYLKKNWAGKDVQPPPPPRDP
jgi:hypothetical protein